MYAAMWRAIPGPTWFKFLVVLLALAGILYLLFEYVYPWVADEWGLNEQTVG